MKNKKKSKVERNSLIRALVIAIIVFCGLMYVATPRIGFTPGLISCVLAASVVSFLVEVLLMPPYDSEDDNGRVIVGLVIISAVLTLMLIIGCIASSQMFHVEDVKDRLDMEVVQQEDFIEILPDVNVYGAYAWGDSKTAAKLAARKTGELSDVVSLYTASKTVTTTISDGKIVKYIPIEYGGFFKWMKGGNIPGFIKVDPVSQEAEFVRSEFRYSPSAYFGSNLKRHIRMAHPTLPLGDVMFQLTPEGNPVWVVEAGHYTSGWRILKVDGVLVVDAMSGAISQYSIANLPDWIVAIHGDTATDIYDRYGRLINGYWNFSKVGETSTTDDFGYIAIDGEMYYYTGVTSAVVDGGDESNLGVLLFNAHTGKAKYCQLAGAEEHSAMEAAEGVVQNYGYEAAFPSLTVVNGELTYTMVLKDSNGLVKKYAMVNYSNYTKVAVEDTLTACQKAYSRGTTVNMDTAATKTVVVDSIEYIAVNGDTMVYLRDEDGNVYRSEFNEEYLFIRQFDSIKITVFGDERIRDFSLVEVDNG